jgi:hypothetical protein
MSDALSTTRVLARYAPFALRLYDVATGAPIADGLEISIANRPAGRSRRAIGHSNGIWSARGLPGLHGYEVGPSDDIPARRAARRPFRITIVDRDGRFLPAFFDADLPTDDLFVAPTTNSPPFPMPLIGPGMTTTSVPLFSAPSRSTPATLAVLRAELRETGTERPAAWALLAVTIDGTLRGIGLADQQGRVLVLFPYPEPARRALSSPPSITVFRWTVQLTAFYAPRPSGIPAPDVPDLAALLAQFSAPQPLLASIGSPPVPLGPLQLDDRVPLVARSGLTAPLSSYLYLDAA